MSAALKIEPCQAFRFPCATVGCCEAFECEAPTKAAARAKARQKGWDFTKMKTLRGTVEVWKCPKHQAEYLQRRKEGQAKRLVVHSDERDEREAADDQLLQEAEQRVKGQQGGFSRGFGRVLNGAEMTACEKLQYAFEVIETAGNASMSYDGVGIDNLSYGGKSVADRVLNARSYERRCQLAVVAQVQMKHHDAWRVFEGALKKNLNVIETGDMICRLRKDRKGKHARRGLAADLMAPR